jgi:hypothetical protein
MENVRHNRPHAIKRRLREIFGEIKYSDDDRAMYKATLKISVSAFAIAKNRKQHL